MPSSADQDPRRVRPDDSAAARGGMVLLIDDQFFVGEAVRRLLADEKDLAFHYCADPTQAVAIASDIAPTVILLDLVMPGMSGLELLQHFRANGPTAETPIVVLSTKEDARVKHDAFAHGASDYLVKLPDRVELVARVRYHSSACINQRRRSEAAAALGASQRALAERVAQLQEALDELEQLQRTKTDFYSMVTHDLRNPAGNVNVATKMLLSGKAGELTPRQRQFVTIAATGGEKMLHLISRYLDFAKIDAGYLRLDVHDVDVAALVQLACDTAEPQAEVKRQRIATTIPPGPMHIRADGSKLAQVFENLLSNAVKYSPEGSTIAVTLEKDGDRVSIRVSDTGIGVDPALLPLLFSKYQRLPGQGTRGVQGTGLGLLIAKEIVEGHDGTIHAQSTGVPGEGTTFTCSIPVAGPAPRDA